MARTSKRAERAEMRKTEAGRIYSVGIYARLSVERDERKNESIETQVEIAKLFLERQKDMVLYDCYTDLGKTGTSFAREGFERMMEDVRRRNIDCVIVKDLSRFGRNHIETGNYIEKIFPFLGVRFIAVDDHFDSMDPSPAGLGVDLTNLMNEMYARDIAVKVKASKRVKWEQGSYTGGIPAYGYRAEWSDGKKYLLVEEETAKIVREIYGRFLSGENMEQIRRWLHGQRIHRPADYRRTGHIYCQSGEELREWPRSTVKCILTNPVYTGCLVQGMTCGKDYRNRKHSPGIPGCHAAKTRKRHDVAPGDWSVKENTHEAVISEELFAQAALRFEETAVYCNRNGYSKTVPKEEDVFGGVLFCGECGAGMTRSNSVKELSSGDRIRRYSYYCPASKRMDGGKCRNKYLSKEKLEQLVKAALRQEFSLSGLRMKGLAEKNRQGTQALKTEWERRIDGIGKEIESVRRLGSEQYVKYRMGELGQEEFIRGKEENDAKVGALEREKESIVRQLKTVDAESARKEHFLRGLMKCGKKTELTKDVVDTLIHRIDIYPDKRVRVTFAFRRADIIAKYPAKCAGDAFCQITEYPGKRAGDAFSRIGNDAGGEAGIQ